MNPTELWNNEMKASRLAQQISLKLFLWLAGGDKKREKEKFLAQFSANFGYHSKEKHWEYYK